MAKKKFNCFTLIEEGFFRRLMGKTNLHKSRNVVCTKNDVPGYMFLNKLLSSYTCIKNNLKQEIGLEFIFLY
jgi:hypothetical protein